jgi:TetR/AcrR family transcriptional regulator, cholesterol catabolism regulator
MSTSTRKSAARQRPVPQASNISRRRKEALTDGSADYRAKRDELVRVAARLFKEKGYKATTLNDIAQAAGLDRATVYYYVGNKEEFFRESVKGITDINIAEAERLVRAKTLDPREKVRLLVEQLMRSYEENYPQMYVYIQEEMHQLSDQDTAWARQMAEHTHRFEKAMMTLLSQGIARGTFRADLPVQLAANALFGMFNWTHRWYKPGGKHTAHEISEAFCSIFFDGVGSEAA